MQTNFQTVVKLVEIKIPKEKKVISYFTVVHSSASAVYTAAKNKYYAQG